LIPVPLSGICSVPPAEIMEAEALTVAVAEGEKTTLRVTHLFGCTVDGSVRPVTVNTAVEVFTAVMVTGEVARFLMLIVWELAEPSGTFPKFTAAGVAAMLSAVPGAPFAATIFTDSTRRVIKTRARLPRRVPERNRLKCVPEKKFD